MHTKLALPDGTIIDVPEHGKLSGWKVSQHPPDPELYFEHDGDTYRVADIQVFPYVPFSSPFQLFRLELVGAPTN